MTNYILTYNPFAVAPTAGQLLNHVRISRFVTQYYQPFPGTYLLKSPFDAFSVNESFKGLFEESPYMLVYFDAHASSGQLPTEIWSWINTGYIPPAPPTTGQSAFDSLLSSLKQNP